MTAMIKLHCQYCGVYCGQRPDEIVFRMAKGAKVEIEATCADCNRPPDHDTPYGNTSIDDLMNALRMKK
jgi:hypothetical protein